MTVDQAKHIIFRDICYRQSKLAIYRINDELPFLNTLLIQFISIHPCNTTELQRAENNLDGHELYLKLLDIRIMQEKNYEEQHNRLMSCFYVRRNG